MFRFGRFGRFPSFFFLFHYRAKTLRTNVICNFTKKKKKKKKKKERKKKKNTICCLMGPLRLVLRINERSWSRFVQIAFWLILGRWILGWLRIYPGRCRSTTSSWMLWVSSTFIRTSLDFHSLIGKLRCLQKCALWIRISQKPLNLLPQTHLVAGSSSSSFSWKSGSRGYILSSCYSHPGNILCMLCSLW